MDSATFLPVEPLQSTPNDLHFKNKTKAEKASKEKKICLKSHIISSWQKWDFSFSSTLISHFSLQDNIIALVPELSFQP